MSRSQNIHHLAHFEGAFALLLFIIDNDPTLVILKIFVDTDLIIVLVEVKLLLEGLLDGIHGRASQRLLLVLVRDVQFFSLLKITKAYTKKESISSQQRLYHKVEKHDKKSAYSSCIYIRLVI